MMINFNTSSESCQPVISAVTDGAPPIELSRRNSVLLPLVSDDPARDPIVRKLYYSAHHYTKPERLIMETLLDWDRAGIVKSEDLNRESIHTLSGVRLKTVTTVTNAFNARGEMVKTARRPQYDCTLLTMDINPFLQRVRDWYKKQTFVYEGHLRPARDSDRRESDSGHIDASGAEPNGRGDAKSQSQNLGVGQKCPSRDGKSNLTDEQIATRETMAFCKITDRWIWAVLDGWATVPGCIKAIESNVRCYGRDNPGGYLRCAIEQVSSIGLPQYKEFGAALSRFGLDLAEARKYVLANKPPQTSASPQQGAVKPETSQIAPGSQETVSRDREDNDDYEEDGPSAGWANEIANDGGFSASYNPDAEAEREKRLAALRRQADMMRRQQGDFNH
jgi:hypothetical protein